MEFYTRMSVSLFPKYLGIKNMACLVGFSRIKRTTEIVYVYVWKLRWHDLNLTRNIDMVFSAMKM